MANETRVEGWVQAVVDANSLAGLRAIVEQTHTEEPTDASHPLAMADAIRRAAKVEQSLLVCGAEDMLVADGAAQALADAGGWRFVEVPQAAHAVPVEAPTAWRQAVMRFLDEEYSSG